MNGDDSKQRFVSTLKLHIKPSRNGTRMIDTRTCVKSSEAGKALPENREQYIKLKWQMLFLGLTFKVDKSEQDQAF